MISGHKHVRMNTIPEANGSQSGRVLGANMAYGFMFAELPKTQKPNVITDPWGYKWKQETTTGYRREHDQFFIPFSPLSERYNHENHSVEARIEIWNQIQNSNGETVVGTMQWPLPKLTPPPSSPEATKSKLVETLGEIQELLNTK